MSWLPKNKVLVPVDLSERSFHAITPALSMVKEISGLHVLSIIRPFDINVPKAFADSKANEKRFTLARKDLLSKMEEYDLKEAVTVIREAKPISMGIINYAKEIEAELIVMTSLGHTGLKRIMIGSVAERVARYAHCPVLILRSVKQK